MLKATKAILVVTLLLAAVTAGVEVAAAQEAPNGTATSTPQPETTVQVIGPTTRITDVEYRDGTFHLVVEADVPVLLTAVEGVDVNAQGTSTGTISFTRQSLSSGKNEVTVAAPLNNGRAIVVLSVGDDAAYVSHAKNTGLISGPYDSADVWQSGAGAAFGVALAVLIGAVRAKLGGREEGERVA
jgi:hypothetical protein